MVADDSLGTEVASRLRHRLAELHAAQSIADLPSGKPRVDPSCEDNLILDLAESHQLVLSANHATNPKTDDGKIDWLSVHRIKIMKIEQTQ